MLVRRGFQATVAPLDLPFPADLDAAMAERVAERLGHYAFRLFLRGAILQQGSFTPDQATRDSSRAAYPYLGFQPQGAAARHRNVSGLVAAQRRGTLK